MDTPHKTPPALFVLGMHRSGTSALVRALNLAGLRLPAELVAPNQDNPLGYWESKSVVAFNDRLMQHFERHWADPKPLPPSWHSLHIAGCGAPDAAMLLRQDLDGPEVQAPAAGLAIKDPRLSRTIPFWRRAAGSNGIELACWIAVRSPEEVYRSLYQRERMGREHALHLWLAYMLDAEAGTRGMRRAVVSYDALLSDWKATLGAAFDDISWPRPSGLELNADKIAAFLNPSNRHHRADNDKRPRTAELEADAEAAYRLFLAPAALPNTTEFDNLRRRHIDRWRRLSCGPGGSSLPKSLPGWHAEQAWKLRAEGRVQDALDAAQRATGAAPGIMRFHFIEGNMLLAAERPDEAIAALQAAIGLDAGQPKVHRLLSKAFEQSGDLDSAVSALREAVALKPKNPYNHNALGLLLQRAGDLAGAHTSLRNAIALDAKPAAFQISLAQALTESGDRLEAIDTLQALCARDDARAGWFERLGQLLLQENRCQAATAAFDAALRKSYAKFGFRRETDSARTGETAAEPGQQLRAELRRFLARLSTRHWVADLTAAMRAPQDDDAEVWPLGRRLPRPQTTALPAGADTTDDVTLSVMMPVYQVKHEDWLREAVDGVLCQTDTEKTEIVFIDDASDNPTARLVAESHGSRIRYVRNDTNLGLVGVHNRCISEARGKFVHILHQDDGIKPGLYDALLPPMQNDDRYVAAFAHTGYIAPGTISELREIDLQSRGNLEDWPTKLAIYRIQFPSIVVRRDAYNSLGGFSPAFRFAFDWDMWNRLFASGPVWYEPTTLARYRVHKESASYSFSAKDRVVEAMQVIASLLQLIPESKHHAVAELAMQKVFLRYWSMIDATDRTDRDAREMIAFLTHGWASPAETEQIVQMLSTYRRTTAAKIRAAETA